MTYRYARPKHHIWMKELIISVLDSKRTGRLLFGLFMSWKIMNSQAEVIKTNTDHIIMLWKQCRGQLLQLSSGMGWPTNKVTRKRAQWQAKSKTKMTISTRQCLIRPGSKTLLITARWWLRDQALTKKIAWRASNNNLKILSLTWCHVKPKE